MEDDGHGSHTAETKTIERKILFERIFRKRMKHLFESHVEFKRVCFDKHGHEDDCGVRLGMGSEDIYGWLGMEY